MESDVYGRLVDGVYAYVLDHSLPVVGFSHFFDGPGKKEWMSAFQMFDVLNADTTLNTDIFFQN